MRFRTERERRLVLLGGVITAVLLYLGVIVLPTLDSIDKNEKALVTARKNLDEARALAAELEGLRTQAEPKGPPISPIQAVDQATRAVGIADRVEEMRALGDGSGVELRLGGVNGDTLVRLLHHLQLAGIHPDGLELRDFKGEGLWNVRLTVTPATTRGAS